MKYLYAALMFGLLLSTSGFSAKAEVEDLQKKIYDYKAGVAKLDDNLLAALLKIPFEKRVYVYPALFESDEVSRKITTHPQILPWKGKKPTKIAPRMQEFAKDHLDTMQAKFYPYLDPDNWPQDPKEDDWHNVSKMIPRTVVNPATRKFQAETN